MIPVSEKNAAALRNLLRQIDGLNAQARGHIDALYSALDVPQGWQFDIEQMAFVEPPAAPAREEGDDEPA